MLNFASRKQSDSLSLVQLYGCTRGKSGQHRAIPLANIPAVREG